MSAGEGGVDEGGSAGVAVATSSIGRCESGGEPLGAAIALSIAGADAAADADADPDDGDELDAGEDSGVVAVAVADSRAAASACRRAARRPGVPSRYITIDSGNAPYSTKVNTAPSTVPCGLVASAAAISSTTYIQAMATRYMKSVKVLR